jgi:hypothetical protein
MDSVFVSGAVSCESFIVLFAGSALAGSGTRGIKSRSRQTANQHL